MPRPSSHCWRTDRMSTRSSSFTEVNLLFSAVISPRPSATSASGRLLTPMTGPGCTYSAMRLSSPGNRLRASAYLQAARDHEILYKLIDRASTEEGRQNMSLLKELGAAYDRVGLIPEAKAWYKLAVAKDPTDTDVQVALYHLGAAALLPDRRRSGRPVHALPEKGDASGGPSS